MEDTDENWEIPDEDKIKDIEDPKNDSNVFNGYFGKTATSKNKKKTYSIKAKLFEYFAQYSIKVSLNYYNFKLFQ